MTAGLTVCSAFGGAAGEVEAGNWRAVSEIGIEVRGCRQNTGMRALENDI